MLNQLIECLKANPTIKIEAFHSLIKAYERMHGPIGPEEYKQLHEYYPEYAKAKED